MSISISETIKKCQHWVSTGKTAAAESVLDLAFPPSCALCNRLVSPGVDFCQDCRVSLVSSEFQMRHCCLRCGFPLGRPVINENENSAGPIAPTGNATPSSGCPQCKEKTFQFDGVIPMWTYHGLVCDAVVASKYVHLSPLAAALGNRLGRCVANRLGEDLPDVVTFVPSYFTRQLSRGGIGTATLARSVGESLGVPVRPLLQATRKIKKQAWLDDDSRLHNVRDAFKIKRSYAFGRSPNLLDRHILVVDDVYTTGATVNEIAGVLRGGGAFRVSVAVVARAVRAT
ncbi:DNA utilization protein GntX [Planctomycetes bacterium CA13]|uniref:DNA utilization protein GntX n=1 Tax=Novipirellula herctigrandis TaxID=2527986 RepID=A0A5C5Z6G1_9BACT|nr:DNA utilization protein GntX [Planctomycetes bacterium CA13]